MKSSTPKAKRSTQRKPLDTFWTICNLCKLQYEFDRVFVNCMLHCNTCWKPFLAKETAMQPPGQEKQASEDTARGAGNIVSDSNKSGSGQAGPELDRNKNKEKVPHNGTANVSGIEQLPTRPKMREWMIARSREEIRRQLKVLKSEKESTSGISTKKNE